MKERVDWFGVASSLALFALVVAMCVWGLMAHK